MNKFPGGVFCKQLADGRAGAELSVSRERLSATTTAGERFELDPTHCHLELGGASGRMWFCRATDGSLTLFSEAFGFDQALLEVPRLREAVAAILASRAQQRRRSAAMWFALVVVAAAVLVGSYFGLRKGVQGAVLALPISVDERIGEVAIGSMDLGGQVITTPAVQDAVAAIVQRLAAHDGADFNYHVRVVQAPITNAFALPGGEIVVYTGLLTTAPSAEAVAGVLAHEMGHVVERHGLQRITQSLGVAAAFQLLVGDVAGLSALGVQLLREGALLSYGRDQERQADHIGMSILQRSGIDPRNLAVVFETLQKEHKPSTVNLPWLSSHPDLSERIATVEREANALGPFSPKPLDVDFAAMRAALNAPLNMDSKEGDHAPATTPPEAAASKEALPDGN